MPAEQTVPLNPLIHSAANVRTGRTEGLGEIAASIADHGLRQNLKVVLQGQSPERFEVIAGARRLRALKQLAKPGASPRRLCSRYLVATR